MMRVHDKCLELMLSFCGSKYILKLSKFVDDKLKADKLIKSFF